MTNNHNLRALSTDEARKIGKKGGIASGKARQQKKAFREALITALATDDVQDNIIYALIKKALTGDIKAIETILTVLGKEDELSGGQAKVCVEFIEPESNN